MQLSATLDGDVITAQLDDRSAAPELLRSATQQGGFMLGISAKPEPFAVYTIVLEADGEFRFDFQAQVVQIFDQGSAGLAAAFQLEHWSKAKDDELTRKLRAEAGSQGDAEDEGELRGKAPIYRIKSMNTSEKLRLAMQADRAERQILCRDSSPQVLLGLLANPRIEASDVLQIVKSNHASAGVLQRVAKDRRWMTNSEIQTAIVRNPKTPTPIAIQLLETVPTRELQSMAKMGALRETVRRAAFRAYTKRKGRR